VVFPVQLHRRHQLAFAWLMDRPAALLCGLFPAVAMMQSAPARHRNYGCFRRRLWLDRSAGGRIFTEAIGRGATGLVYRAIDPNIGRPVAIKIIQFTAAGEDVQKRLRDRLLREARSVGRLSHPAIIAIYDVDQESDLAYIIMEYIDGATLKDVLARPNPITCEVMFQC
jgi:hypothetical protein